MHLFSRRKLIMTLLVRDEVDIVEKNICYHLSQGVQHIIATDNGSTDGTVKILEKYARLGYLTLLREPAHTYEQSKWVSRMTKIAADEHKATHLFHCDADEFWVPQKDSLLDALPKQSEVFQVSLRNYLPEPSRNERFAQHRTWVHRPYARQAARLTDPSYRYLLYEYEPKILTTAHHTEVAQGNHLLQNLPENVCYKHCSAIVIHHFPVRSYKQFERKVVNGGSSYAQNPDQSPDIGWQWKEWYILWKKKLLPTTYRLLCIPSAERNLLVQLDRISQTKLPDSIINAEKNWKRMSLKNNRVSTLHPQ